MASNVDAVREERLRRKRERERMRRERVTNEERQARFVNLFGASYRDRSAEQRDESRDGHQTTNQSEREREAE